MYSDTELTANQKAIIASTIKNSAYWLFEIVENSTTHYWSDFSSKVFGGHTYTFKVCNFSEIQMRANGAEYGLIAPSEATIRLTNKGNTLDPADYEGAAVTIRLVLAAKIGGPPAVLTEAEVRSWGFECIRAENINQELVLYCRSWLDKYLLGDYPNTPLIEDIFPSSDPKTEKNNACVPVIFGAAYIPLESAFITDARYYVLGASAPTYTITEVRSPKEWGSKSVWTAAGGYTFTQSTKTGRDGNTYKVVQPIIADANGDGTADANGLFPQGEKFLPIPCEYSSSVTSAMTNPANVIRYILEAMGVPTARINTASVTAAAAIFTGWGLAWSGGLWYKRNCRELLAELLNQCDMSIIVRDQLYFRVHSKTSMLTIDKTHVQLNGDKDTYTSRRLVADDQKDSCYIAFQPDGCIDQLIKIVVPAKTTTAKPSTTVYEMPFVHDSQLAQQLGTVACQRVLLQHSEISFRTNWTNPLRLEVSDVITVDHTDYGGTIPLLLTAMNVNPVGWIDFRALRFKDALNDVGDLSPGAISVVTDTSTNTYQMVTCGPDSSPTSGGIPNALPGPLRIGTGVNYIRFDPAEPIQTFVEGGQVRLKIGDLGTDDYGVQILDHAGNSILKLDGAGVNTLCGWNIDASKIYKTNAYLSSSGYVSFGSSPPSAYGNNVGAWLGYSSGAKMSLYADASNYFQWDGSKLLVKAANFTLDSSGNVTANGGTIGGFTIGSTALAGGTTNIVLDSSAKAISINSSTYGNSGIQLQYNAGTPRFYVGDGSTKYVKWTGSALEMSVGTIKEFQIEVYTSGVIKTNADPATNGGFLLDSAKMIGYVAGGGERFRVDLSGTDAGDVTIGDYAGNKGLKWDQSVTTFEVRGGFKTTSGAVKRFELSSTTNEAYFYGDRGDGTIALLASIGINSGDYSDGVILQIGNTSTEKYGIYAVSENKEAIMGVSGSGIGVYGSSTDDYGIYGNSTNEIGVYGISTNSYGIWGYSNNSYGGYFRGDSDKAPIVLAPSTSASPPTHTASKGAILITSDGIPYHNMDGSTTWYETVLASLKGTFTWDPANMATDGGALTTVAVTGAALGDYVIVCAPYYLNSVIASAYVKEADVIEIILKNCNVSDVNLASGTWKYKIIKH